MRFSSLVRNKKRLVFFLGLYLFASGIFVMFFKHYKLVERINIPSWPHDGFGNIQRFFHLNSSDVDFAGENFTEQYNNSPSIHTSEACLEKNIYTLDTSSQHLLQKRNMLQYFKIGNRFAIAKPDWQVEMTTKRDSQLDTKSPKYFIASILRVRLYAEDKAKWTVRELKQWLHYQFFAGAEHVYICIHFLNESERFDNHLKEYIKHGLVSIVWWNNITAVPGAKTYDSDSIKNQVACYNYILDNYRQDAVWHYNFDMDENPYVPNDHCEGFLKRYLEKLTPDISELRLANYVLQGQCDRSRDIFYDRINRITPNVLNGNVKPIYKISMTTRAGMHGSQTTGKMVNPDHKDLIMLHYWGARIQKWQNDTDELYKRTIEFNTVRYSIAINVRHSLIAFGEHDAFAKQTGP